MGINNEFAGKPPLVFDIETAPIVGVETYLEPVSAPSNYKDEAKIAAYIAEAEKTQADKAALDPDLARIVALGFRLAKDTTVVCAMDEDSERALLRLFWETASSVRYGVQFVGFGNLEFDLPVLYRRSLYLDVPSVSVQIDRFKHPDVTDLMQILSFNGRNKYHSLGFYAARFGLLHEDAIKGAQIPALVLAGDWEAVQAHVRADVDLTWQQIGRASCRERV